MKYSIIYLAAGLSRRFGENKLTSKYNNKYLFQCGLDALCDTMQKRGCCDELVVVTRYDEISEYVASLASKLLSANIQCVHNNESEKGISTSIRLGVEACTSTDGYLFLVADEPNITSATILSMMTRFETDSCSILYASYKGISGNPVIFSSSFRDELLALTGDCGGKRIIKAHLQLCHEFEVTSSEELEDIDEKVSCFAPAFADKSSESFTDEKGYIRREKMLDYFRINPNSNCVISVVGAGGKTTLIDMLSREIAKHGRVIVATTTHMRYPEFIHVYSIDDILHELPQDERIIIVNGHTDGSKHSTKLSSVLPHEVQALTGYNIPILLEADGSHCLPCKAPADHEPVIPQATDIVIGVLGALAVGHPLHEVCHRPVYAAKLLNKGMDDIITREDLSLLLGSSMGQKKNVTDKMNYYAVINEWKY